MSYHKNIFKKFRLDITDINIENSNIFKFVQLNLKSTEKINLIIV